MATKKISATVNAKNKETAQDYLKQMGIPLSTGIDMFLAQVVNVGGLPFTPTVDPFYSPNNMAVLEQSIADADAGKVFERELIED